ncbi:MarR family transcriptional regulator [Streptomyces sp. MK7]|uniref:MarR family transcriptional regulator n=1 Tax=Streptomyces sp. MK7 TaxID=3067635 RepID=UPI00292D0182|nr:MarR family transcriptional regulator [Streptomyces sp. MK7]
MTTTAHTTAHATGSAPTPAMDSRLIGVAHYAARAVLEKVLSRYHVTFQEMVTLRPVATAGGPVEHDRLVGRTAAALKADEAGVRDVIGQLIAKGLLAADGPHLRITDAGQTFYAGASAETAEIAARIYAGIPAEDLAAAARVLTTVTERAEAELAALAS